MDIETILFEKVRDEKLKWLKFIEKGKRNEFPNFREFSEALDEFYIFSKVKLFCALLSYEIIVGTKAKYFNSKDFFLLDAMVGFGKTKFESNFLLLIYIDIIKLFKSINESKELTDKLYNNIAKTVNENLEKLTPPEAEEILSFLTNFCIWKINKREEFYTKKFILASSQILNLRCKNQDNRNVSLPAPFFRNIVAVALGIKNDAFFSTFETFGISKEKIIGKEKIKYIWVQEFIENYKDKLNEVDYPFYYPYTKAVLAFEKGDFYNAFKLIEQLKTQNELFVNYSFRVFYLKVLYEVYTNQSQIEHLTMNQLERRIELALEAFRSKIKYQKSKKENSYQMKYYHKFEGTFRRLLAFYNKYNNIYYPDEKSFKKRKNSLIEDITQLNYSYKEWLIMKVESVQIT